MLDLHLTLTGPRRKEMIDLLKEAEREGQVQLYKRLLALLELSRDRSSIAQVARNLQVQRSTIRSWLKLYLLGGTNALRPQPSPGRPAKLSPSQRQELAEILDQGPAKAGFVGNCWRSPMIQVLLCSLYAVTYSVKYIPQLLDTMGFSFQKARFTSDHLDEEERKEFIEVTIPQVLKEARERNAYLMFGDEVSFAQWGSLCYTWARKGVQPTVETSGTRKGYKVFGMIDYFSGRFFYKGQVERFTSQTYIQFLEEVLRRTRKHIYLVQDGAPYHTSAETRRFFEKRKDRITVVQLPSYSPDYNPIEKLWKKVKEKGTHLHYFPTFEALIDKVQESLIQFEDMPEEILSLFARYQKIDKGIKKAA